MSSPQQLGRIKLAEAKRDAALHALDQAKKTKTASDVAVARVACDVWLEAERRAGRLER